MCFAVNKHVCYKLTQLHSYQILLRLINIWLSYCEKHRSDFFETRSYRQRCENLCPTPAIKNKIMTLSLALRRVVDDVINFAVERFLANTKPISTSAVRDLFITSHIEAVDWRVKGQGHGTTRAHWYRSYFTGVWLQLVDVLQVVVRHDKIFVLRRKRS